jgi:hypothetical protein
MSDTANTGACPNHEHLNKCLFLGWFYVARQSENGLMNPEVGIKRLLFRGANSSKELLPGGQQRPTITSEENLRRLEKEQGSSTLTRPHSGLSMEW